MSGERPTGEARWPKRTPEELEKVKDVLGAAGRLNNSVTEMAFGQSVNISEAIADAEKVLSFCVQQVGLRAKEKITKKKTNCAK